MKDNFLGKKMRNLRSINKVNEDNVSGYHTNTVYTGADRAVTGGNDAPLPVTGQQVKNSIKNLNIVQFIAELDHFLKSIAPTK